MIFRNLVPYRCEVNADIAPAARLAEVVRQFPMHQPQLLEWRRDGWLPVRGIESELSFYLPDYDAAVVMHGLAERLLPGAVLREHVAEQCRQYERDRGFAPSRKTLREIRDRATTELLPKAFVKVTPTPVLLDGRHGRIYVATSSCARADDIVSRIRDQLQAHITPLDLTNGGLSLVAQLGQWLAAGDAPEPFGIAAQECELRGPHANREVVAYRNHDASDDQVKRLLSAGFACTRLSLTRGTTQSFVLHEDGRVAKLALDPAYEEDQAAPESDPTCAWEADVRLAISEIRALFRELERVLS
ncbi:recombination-associated protein RdgC [Algiphilus sp.]|uniref:recombination-associated protein RdgC n=1 Tax=Algiphilus sp. TaxID=1872431 RepID=UPI003C5E90CF